MEITIQNYQLSAPLPAAPWFVYVHGAERAVHVRIMTAAEAAEILTYGAQYGAPWFAGTIVPAKNRKNAERAARRWRNRTGAWKKVAPREWCTYIEGAD